ncbi:methylated-DNA-[protein]-cysteine S-methyltransferase [Microcella alkaliphila]|uniref:Methylated-DNA-[protein]-cysteine S-methyltransferase n=1 Tax=Microcella alkaliphila TaxID=279828 RepID=A0A4Q7TJG9_9MICO|nr:methylated-DNA--[protein]-cysteine S-methyltransferase [Microcella alkaliphila]RZT59740.1 methylated-DNA-[protein]-cysteine S-methyltransferase [Microcella alkaliphila]
MTASQTAGRTAASRTAAARTVATPDGPFTVIADEDAVLASGWTADVAEFIPLIHRTIRPAADELTGSSPALESALVAVERFYAGDSTAPDAVPVRQRSGEFLEATWRVMRGIRPGRPVTYAELAALAGRPAATRPAAAACAMNAAALFVPCHRVLRTGGGLGGFRYGLAIKQSLLDREAGA